jgi:hypothetical protein
MSFFRSKHYKYSEDKLWYRKDIKSDNYLEVPKRQLRYILIHHEHFMGHYQTQTVYAALVKTYYLPLSVKILFTILNTVVLAFVIIWNPKSIIQHK